MTSTRAPRSIPTFLSIAAALACACSDDGGTGAASGVPNGGGSPNGGAGDGGGGQSAGGGGTQNTGGGGAGPSIEAARTTAQTHPACTAILPFYWEIGDAAGVYGEASGSEGADAPTPSTPMLIASATKLVFGAYVVERFQDDLTLADERALRMQHGYVDSNNGPACYNPASAPEPATVGACFDINATYEAASDYPSFYYSAGNFLVYAARPADAPEKGLGLAAMNKDELAAEIASHVGDELGLEMASVNPAGGGRATPGGYAAFLRAVVAGELAMVDHLGEAPVETDCGAGCFSPAAEAWHYSWGHWIEDDTSDANPSAALNDGAFSSPGLFGFYPWISRDKQFYGMVARYDTSAGAYLASAECGRRIRFAFLTGQVPPR
ncbi:MAG: hypothetical protein HOW73_14895 [Polyangiaceae bacterium]|nr:hypothetical protein [Polyangiaceae bacterium]